MNPDATPRTNWTRTEIAGLFDLPFDELMFQAGVVGIYGPGSNVVECAADILRLLGHNMPPLDATP